MNMEEMEGGRGGRKLQEYSYAITQMVLQFIPSEYARMINDVSYVLPL